MNDYKEELKEELKSYIDMFSTKELEMLLEHIETHDKLYNSFFTEEIYYFH